MPKMRAVPQFLSAPLNPIPTAEHFRRSHRPCEHSHGQQVRKITQSKTKTLFNELNLHAKNLRARSKYVRIFDKVPVGLFQT